MVRDYAAQYADPIVAPRDAEVLVERDDPNSQAGGGAPLAMAERDGSHPSCSARLLLPARKLDFFRTIQRVS